MDVEPRLLFRGRIIYLLSTLKVKLNNPEDDWSEKGSYKKAVCKWDNDNKLYNIIVRNWVYGFSFLNNQFSLEYKKIVRKTK